MKFKLKAAVVGVILSAASLSANAAITATSGNSELVFSAWDSATGVGYTYDLNFDKFLQDFIGADATVNTTGNTTITNARVQSSMINAQGIIFDDVLTGFQTSLKNSTTTEWNLAAYDASGRARMLITEGYSGTGFAASNNGISYAVTSLSTYAPASNSKITVAATDTYAQTVIADGSAYAGNVGSDFNGRTADTTSLLGQMASVYMLAQNTTQSSNQLGINSKLLAFDGRQIVAQTYLDNATGNMRLRIAAVPEADTSAMMLAGIGLMGFIARRRKSK